MPFFQTNFLYSWIVLTSIAADMKFPSAAEYALFYYWRGLGFGGLFFFLRSGGVGVCSFIKLEKPIVSSYAYNFLYVDRKLK